MKINQLVELVSETLKIPVEEIMGRRRSSEIARARKVCYQVAYDRGYSLREIAEYFDRDHSTISDGCRSVRQSNKQLIQDEYQRVKRMVDMVARHKEVL